MTAGSTPVCSPVSGSGVRDFFAGRSVLVTGATGFMGKMMVEKLLRTCERIRHVYVLVRCKDGSDAGQRLKEILDAEIFQRLLKERPDAVDKLKAVAGELTMPSLGLSEDDQRTLVEEVSVVFHLAATVRFDEPLKKALDINLRGSKRVVDLCRKMTGLKALVYVSTAYSHCQRREIREEFYPSYVHPVQLMEAIESMDDELVAAITPQLMAGRPNTYVLSKAMAEQLLVEEAGELPVAVVRPSVVVAAWKEPLPGWSEGYFGPNGHLIGFLKGVLRCNLNGPESRLDFVPVDVATNLTIAAAWFAGTKRTSEALIYNCTPSEGNRLTCKEIWEIGFRVQERQPVRPFWHPEMRSFANLFIFRLCFYLTMLYPGCLIDAIAWATGKKPLFLKLQKKMLKTATSVGYYTTREWSFSNDNVWNLWNAMEPGCRRDFDFDVREIDWPPFYINLYAGLKRFVLKEDSATIEDDLRHARKMRLVHRLCQLSMAFVLFRLLLAFCPFPFYGS